MTFKMCPQCFAELYQQSVCAFCGYNLEQDLDPKIVLTPPATSSSKFELTGLPFQAKNFFRIPKGTLFFSRYSILQYKQQIEEGACYIAYDHWTGQHTFVTLWQNPTPISKYHQDILHISPVYDTGNDPAYSSFLPQEGLPIEQALMKLGWTTGRVWEVFRQVCQVVITSEEKGGRLPLFPPHNLWIRPDGIVELSLQPDNESDFSGGHIPQLVALLGWLYDAKSELHLSMFPLKLRPVLYHHWNHPSKVQKFWQDIDSRIRDWGWYTLPELIRSRLLNDHYPNAVWLFENIVEIPDSIRLCIWNAVSGTWRLKNGKVILRSSLEALYEVGVIDSSQDRPNLELLERLALGETVACDADLASVLLHLRYGNRSDARMYLANYIRTNSNFDTWIEIAEVFFAIGETHAALEIVFIAASKVTFIREALELASVVCWNTADYRWVRRFLTISLPKEATIWELTDFTEGWVALLGAYPDKTIRRRIESQYRNSNRHLQQQWEAHCLDHFGSMVSALFDWNSTFKLK